MNKEDNIIEEPEGQQKARFEETQHQQPEPESILYFSLHGNLRSIDIDSLISEKIYSIAHFKNKIIEPLLEHPKEEKKDDEISDNLVKKVKREEEKPHPEKIDHFIFVHEHTVLQEKVLLQELASKTSKKHPLRVAHWFLHLKDDDPKCEFFFVDRGITIASHLEKATLNPFLADVEKYEVEKFKYDNFCDDIQHGSFENEASLSPLIWNALKLALKGLNFRIVGQPHLKYSFDTIPHISIPDYVIVDFADIADPSKIENPDDKPEHLMVFITEIKSVISKLSPSVIQNFDQLRTYSFNSDKNYFLGVVTDLGRWYFTCYIKPPEGKDPTIDHFMVSSNYAIPFDVSTRIPDKERLNEVIGTIRGILTNKKLHDKLSTHADQVNEAY